MQVLDFVLVFIMIFSGLLGIVRGLYREMLSLINWAAAALITLVIYAQFRSDFRTIVGTPRLADAILILVVFIAGLIGFSFLTDNIAVRLAGKEISVADQRGGFAYGLVRGLFVVTIAYLIVNQFVDRQDLPEWVTRARSLYVIEKVGDGFRYFLPDNPNSAFSNGGQRPSTR